jgi:hypothetical protein
MVWSDAMASCWPTCAAVIRSNRCVPLGIEGDGNIGFMKRRVEAYFRIREHLTRE